MEEDQLGANLQNSLEKLIEQTGRIQIGNREQFPYGWRKAAKGRTVWRILEELITQNLESKHEEYGIHQIRLPDSEVGVYDFECSFSKGGEKAYINIKSSVEGGRSNKDDISKARGLLKFYEDNVNAKLYIATFYIRFNEDMTIEFPRVSVFPAAWLPDIYVNPSNNGNLQSAKYKDISNATPRSNREFINELVSAIEIANEKRRNKGLN